MSDALAPGLLSRLPAPPRKVAIFRASRIGDFVCATPALRALRAALVGAEITLVALPLVQELAARSPHVDRFVPFPGAPGIAEQYFDARRLHRFLGRMQEEHFDLAVQMHGSGVYANPLTLMLGATRTAGFMRPGDAPGPLDAALPIPTRGRESDRMLALAEFLGAPAHGTDTEFPLRPEDAARADALLRRAAPPLIGLQPGARDASRRWPAERFAAAGAALRDQYGGTLVVLGGPDERAIAGRVVRHAGPPALDVVGPLPLPVMGAIIARLALLITNDTGPAHIAYALGVPTVTLFALHDAEQWTPPPRARHRVLGAPIEAITVAQVVEAAGEALRLAEADDALADQRVPDAV